MSSQSTGLIQLNAFRNHPVFAIILLVAIAAELCGSVIAVSAEITKRPEHDDHYPMPSQRTLSLVLRATEVTLRD